MSSKRLFRFAACQFKAVANKEQNLNLAKQFILESADKGAEVIALPEFFNCPLTKSLIPAIAEDIKDKNNRPTYDFLKEMAKETKSLLIGGSMPEKDESGKVYNTSLVFDKHGKLIAKHRKIHMFDIDIPGQQFKESEYITPGDHITVFNSEFGKMGLGICYDMRFPEQALIMANKGAEMILYPAAFNATTGPLHFELLGRARALDTQCFVALIGQARNFEDTKGYQSWGHSMIVNPNGAVIAQADLGDKLLIADIDLAEVDKQRQGFQYSAQKRKDVYHITYHKEGSLKHSHHESDSDGVKPKVGYPAFQKDVMKTMDGVPIPKDGKDIKVGYNWFQLTSKDSENSAPRVGYPGFQESVMKNNLGIDKIEKGQAIKVGYTTFQYSDRQVPKVGYTSFQRDVYRKYGLGKTEEGGMISVGYNSFQFADNKLESKAAIGQCHAKGYTPFQIEVMKANKTLTAPAGKPFITGYNWFQTEVMQKLGL